MFKNDKDIEFVSTVPGLYDIEECRPKPSIEFTPKWWKDVEIRRTEISSERIGPGNVKNCPSFSDYFSNGYIIPAWSDMLLSYDSKSQTAGSNISSDKFTITMHGHNQYLSFVNHIFMGKKTYMVFKLNNPWNIITKPGYSVYQLPTIYHFNEDVSVMAGVVDTDIHHQVNLQLLIHTDKKDIFIPRGTPLVNYVPFKRKTYSYDVRDANKKDLKIFKKLEMEYTTKYNGSKVYHKLRQERDKNV